MRALLISLAIGLSACSDLHMGPGGQGGGSTGGGHSGTGGGGGSNATGGGGTSTGAENCTNHADDDGDGFIDCADPDCFTDTACFQTCLDLCTTGAVICDGTGTRACETDSMGCKMFGAVTACGASLVCSGGACVSSCTNQCSPGMKQCSNTGGIVECQMLATGCTDWVGPTACGSTEVCSAGTCVAQGMCTNQCTAGATRCTTGGQQQTCVNQSSGCTDWSFPAPCSGGGMTCTLPATACAAALCTPGQTQCTNNVASVCNAQGAWVSTPCGSQMCQSGACVDPTCFTGCSTPPGAACLNPNTAVTYSAAGTCVNAQCSYPQQQTACPYGCASGACAAASTCTPNARRCNGSQIQVCNGNGSAWLFAQTCTGTCTNGLCDAPCTPNAVRCNNSTVETCNAGGTAWTQGAACAQGCLAGACLTDELVVNGNTVQMDGEHHYSTRVWVKNGGQLQVGPSGKLSLYAPSIIVDVSSSITATAASSGSCAAPPDDVAHGIRLVADQVTVNGTITFSGSGCTTDGVVIRADTIDGPGTVTSSERSLLLYGSGGVAPGLMAANATRSLMPPASITSSNYPEGGLYNDDGPPPLFSWSKPASTVTGYYYLGGSSSAVPTPQSTFLATEVLALPQSPGAGTLYLDVVSLDGTGVVGTVPHEFVVHTQGLPPTLSSSTNPNPGTWSPNPTVIVAWDGGNPGLGYYHVFDAYPTTRPSPSTGVFEPPNKSPAQLLMQNVPGGRRWFHMLALDSMGYSTRSAAHYEVDIGAPPDAGTIAGTVKDGHDAGIVGATVVVQRGLYTATTTAGGVYTFGETIPEGQYEVVAKLPDAGLQAAAAMLAVSAFQTSEADFALQTGAGCPTCSDLCAGVACANTVCGGGVVLGTCADGACIDGALTSTGAIPLQLGVTFSGTTAGKPNRFIPSNHTSSTSGSDLLFSFTAPASRSYQFLGTDTFDSILYLTASVPPASVCGPTTVTTVGYADDPPQISSYTMNAGDTVYVIFDAYSTGSGSITLTVQ
jgi:hypothetical protein